MRPEKRWTALNHVERTGGEKNGRKLEESVYLPCGLELFEKNSQRTEHKQKHNR